ncbi:hypothetical protein [Streptomyces sp. NPDC059786]|uniref:hypothetical protein n=1 Tax=Streptomyces sp. NPDC059786 TaxID=3346946 RepID=UPI00364D4002
MTAEQLSIDLDRDDDLDQTPTPDRMRRSEMRDLRDQHARLVDLHTAVTIPTGSYL